MEGFLMKKTKGGQWHSRQFKLDGSNLIWLKSDGKTFITVDVSRNAEVRDVKFGTKKFAFDIILANDQISLAASGEAEKAAWMAALKTAMGKRDEAEGILQQSGAGRKSVRTPLKPINTPKSPATPVAAPAPSPASPVAATSSPAQASTPSPTPLTKTEVGSMVTGGLASQAANAKLAAKIGGKIGATTQVKCVVCDQTVYKPEELIVDKAVMHKRCFQCNHCHRQLTMGNFACINSVFYCKVHYFELFSTNGGKYDKAFGDAGFKTKATTSYTPGEILQPGKIAAKATVASPSKTAATSPVVSPPTSPEPVKADVASTAKPVPKKLEIKAPVSTKAVEKKEIEVIPKKNMDDLRKMVVLPGMAPPKAKKEEPPAPAPEEAKEVAVPAPASPAEVAPSNEAAETPVKEDDKAAEISAPAPDAQETEPTSDAPVTPIVHAELTPLVAEEPPIQIVRPPPGVNFALEAMKIRQAQMAKAGVAPPPPEEISTPEEGRASVRISGRLDHSAVLSKPKMAGRRAPKIQEVGKMLPKTEIDRMTHDFTFRVLIDGPKSSDVLIVHATSQFEKDHWVATLGANVYMLGLKHELEMAQKRDMMSALQAQINLETFLADNKVTYTGFLEKVSMKSQRNWKKRWFELNDKGQLMYYDNENSKKPKQTLQLTYLSVIANADGSRLDAPLVINTKATEMSEESGGSLPLNIAIFDNQDVTIDLNTIVADELAASGGGDAGGSNLTEMPVASSEPTVTEIAIPSEGASSVPEPTKPAESPIEEKNETSAEPANVTPAEAKEDEKPIESKDESLQRINNAWSTPGKSPDRVKTVGEQPLVDSPSSPLANSGSRRKSGTPKNKNCTIM